MPAAGPKYLTSMKNNLFQILLASTVASLVGIGCVNEDRDAHDPVVKLAFEPVMQAQVRADTGSDDESAQYSIEDHYGVSVWMLDKEIAWKSEAPSADSYLEMERLVKNGNLWYPETELDWPSEQFNLSCIGFAPFEAAAACSPTQGVVFDQVDTSTDPGDLRYTEPQVDLAKSHNGGIIPLPMISALCEVDFRIRSVSGYETAGVYVRSITIDGIALKGRFQSLPQPTWSLSDAAGSRLVFFEGEQKAEYTPQTVGLTRRIIPQELDGKVSVVYEFETPAGGRLDQEEKDLPLKISLEAGRHYILTLAVSPAGAEVIPEIPSQLE